MLVCCPALHRNTWPPVGTNAFINLVLIKQSGEIARNYDYSVRGDMDDIVESKETVNYESIFSKYIEGHQLSLLTIHHKLLIIDILWILSLHLNAHFAYMPNFFFFFFFFKHIIISQVVVVIIVIWKMNSLIPCILSFIQIWFMQHSLIFTF